MAQCEQCEATLAGPDSPCPKCGHFVTRTARLQREIRALKALQGSLDAGVPLISAFYAVVTAGCLVITFGLVPSCAVDREFLLSQNRSARGRPR
ncbi:hypothetical protein BH09MYX1_BH09MYX1_38290 [soil metagenome]